MFKLKYLKPLRRLTSVIVIISIISLFIGVNRLYLSTAGDFFVNLQIFPVIIQIASAAVLSAIVVLLLVSIITLLFGRVYCSTVCPMGILQDVFSYFSMKSRPKKLRKFKFSPDRKRILKYSVLALTLVFWISGSLFLINILDPFSNFGKITTAFIQPAYIYFNNFIAFSLEKFEIYKVAPMETKAILSSVVLISTTILLVIGTLSVWRGRLFCNTLCPAGALLSILAEKPLYKISIKVDDCNLCGRCEKVCKAECIDSKNKYIDHGRCVSCFNCFSACVNNGFYYKLSTKSIKTELVEKKSHKPTEADPGKRTFLLTLGAGLVSLPVLNRFKAKGLGTGEPGHIPSGTKHPVTPPGSLSLEHFTSNCIACYLCVSKCPKNVIVPSFFDYGLKGFMQPKLDFDKSYCNYDCVDCTQHCPTGAIKPQTFEEKKLIQIGVARFLYESCVVTVDRTDCGACSEHCPTKAVDMVPYNGLWLPEINPDICIGCGACEYACPTSPYKAIYVESNKIHKEAKPVVDDSGPQEYVDDEFPF